MGIGTGKAHVLGRTIKFFAVPEVGATAAITAFATSDGGAKTQVTSAGHGLANGEVVNHTGTTSYNGTFLVEQVATNTYVIPQAYVGNDATGTWCRDAQGTFVRPAATDAVKTQQTAFKHEIVNEMIDDNHSYRWGSEDIQDKEKNTWSWDGYLIPSGAKATQPDLGPIVTAAMGNAVGTASGWVWTCANRQNWPTLSLTQHFENLWQECMWGAFVDKISFKLSGGAQPMVHAEGRAFGYAFTGASTLQSAMVATNQVLPAAADYYKYGVGSIFKVDLDDGASDLGYKVTVDHATGSITATATSDAGAKTLITSANHGLVDGQVVVISGTTNTNGVFVIEQKTDNTFVVTDSYVGDEATGTWHSALTVINAAAGTAATITEAAGDKVLPHVPTPTFVGSPISGVSGAYQIDSADGLPIQSVEITLENQNEAFEDEIFSQRITDFVPGMAKVTVAIALRVREDQIKHLANAKAFTTKDLYFQVGPSSPGKRYRFDIDYGKPTFPEVSTPKDGIATATLTYVGYGSGSSGPLTISQI